MIVNNLNPRLNTLLILIIVMFGCKPKTNSKEIKQKSVSKTPSYTYLAGVRKNNVWQFINEKGEQLFNKKFTYIGRFSDGIYCVAQNGSRNMLSNMVVGATYYAMDTEGNINKKVKSDMPFKFSEGYAVVSQGPFRNVVDKKGTIIKTFENLRYFSSYNEGLLVVYKADKTISYYDTKGNEVFSASKHGYDDAGGFSEGLAVVVRNKKYGLINKKGELVLDLKYDNLVIANDYFLAKENGKWLLLDREFKTVLGPYDDIIYSGEKPFGVLDKGEWKFVDEKGTPITNETFIEADVFSEGKAVARKKNKTIGFIDTKGNFTKLDGRVALQLKNGFAIAEKNQKMGYVNKNAEWVIEPQYEVIQNFEKK